MQSVDHARLAQLVARIEAWPSAVSVTSSASFRGGYDGSAAANRAIAQRRRAERVQLTSSLRVPATSARKSFVMGSTVPQRQPVYSRRPTVGPELGPGSHEADRRGDIALVREPQRLSPVFLSSKLMPLGPNRADPLAGVNGKTGVPDLLTTKREKVPDLVSTTFHSTTERFGVDGMLLRMRLAQQRLPPPASAFPFNTGLAVRTPAWNFEDDEDDEADEAAVGATGVPEAEE